MKRVRKSTPAAQTAKEQETKIKPMSKEEVRELKYSLFTIISAMKTHGWKGIYTLNGEAGQKASAEKACKWLEKIRLACDAAQYGIPAKRMTRVKGGKRAVV